MKKTKKEIAYIILRILSLLPIVLWPMVFFTSAFFFDNPHANPVMVWSMFLGANAYPLILIANVIVCNKLYKRNKGIAYILLVWPILLCFYIFYEIIWFL